MSDIEELNYQEFADQLYVLYGVPVEWVDEDALDFYTWDPHRGTVMFRWDGWSTNRIALPLHELGHYLAATPKERKLPEFGMGTNEGHTRACRPRLSEGLIGVREDVSGDLSAFVAWRLLMTNSNLQREAAVGLFGNPATDCVYPALRHALQRHGWLDEYRFAVPMIRKLMACFYRERDLRDYYTRDLQLHNECKQTLENQKKSKAKSTFTKKFLDYKRQTLEEESVRLEKLRVDLVNAELETSNTRDKQIETYARWRAGEFKEASHG